MGRQILVAGMDPSLRNWGLATATYDLDTRKFSDVQISVCQPILPTGKQVRQNSEDIEAAAQLTSAAVEVAKSVRMTFVEVPVGSQNARAMASYGICVGILGALKVAKLPYQQLNPSEVKVAATGKTTATKKHMIAWATSMHPEANWPTYKKNGKTHITESDAEHMADAVAAMYAGVSSDQFTQLVALL